ncbi:HTH domain-containing protein [Caldanaerobius polysaccharolyticus]|uniref:HTH domain-containing protein n=1 Tax=Caldanaerobius polysaccharolyticus TaxID=44256 RepID=UPI000478D5D4|nr:HTH domain-containing protein [Caldanaerobius polysaccharolyticus]
MTTTGFVVRVEDTSTRGKVLELIKQSGEDGIVFKDIVQELGVSEETVRHYIREIQDRNMPITEEGGKG